MDVSKDVKPKEIPKVEAPKQVINQDKPSIPNTLPDKKVEIPKKPEIKIEDEWDTSTVTLEKPKT